MRIKMILFSLLFTLGTMGCASSKYTSYKPYGRKRGCRSTWNMAGYGKVDYEKIRHYIDKYGGAWVKNMETGTVVVFNPQGKLIAIYHEKI